MLIISSDWHQVLLGAATLAAKTGSGSIHVLILSECRPLVNLFTCDDLVEHRDQGWLYKVDVEQIRKHLSLPVGSCQLSVPLHDQGMLLCAAFPFIVFEWMIVHVYKPLCLNLW